MIPENWNDLLTVLALLISSVTAYFQVRDFRARPAKPVIRNVCEATYRSGRKSDDLPPDQVDAQFTLDTKIENEGRNRFTISQMLLELPDGEEIEMNHMDFNQHEPHDFDGHASREVRYQGDGRLPKEHPDKIRARLRMVTPAGEDTEKVTFVPVADLPNTTSE